MHCTNDLAIGLGLQKNLVRDAAENGAAELTLRELESDHGRFWSRTAAVVGIVVDVRKSHVGGVLDR